MESWRIIQSIKCKVESEQDILKFHNYLKHSNKQLNQLQTKGKLLNNKPKFIALKNN